MAATGIPTPLVARPHSESRPKSYSGARIAFLDGLRCVAILSVILFHYFTRWTFGNHGHPLYPYSPLLGRMFALGGNGVLLFFIISGFVITLTLQKCRTFKEFLIRRFARLFPAMLLCSLLTLAVIRFLPGSPFHARLSWFLPAATFTGPEIWNYAFPSVHFDNIDGAYWSLYAEVKFYLLAGIVYFFERRRFIRNMAVVSSVTFVLARLARTWVFSSPHRELLLPIHIFFEACLPWFVIGIGAFYSRREKTQVWATPVVLGTVELILAAHRRMDLVIVGMLVLGFFLAMNLGTLNRLLSFRLLSIVGFSSYSLYLLHQQLGVAVIHVVARSLSLGVAGGIAVVLAMTVLATAFCCALYRIYESPANKWVRGVLLRRIDPLPESQTCD